MPSADWATLYMVQNALKALDILVTFRNDDHGVLIAERLVTPSMTVCANCGHYRFTHLEAVDVASCNGQCPCPGFAEVTR